MKYSINPFRWLKCWLKPDIHRYSKKQECKLGRQYIDSVGLKWRYYHKIEPYPEMPDSVKKALKSMKKAVQ